jgi:hypothetical protein
VPVPPYVVGLSVSDLHLTLGPPPARRGEPDWLKAQKRHLDQLAVLKKKYNCPVLYPGDIFHKYNPEPELINFAIKHLPEGYAVPGQHDLPLHNYADIKRTAYWTLVEANKIVNVEPEVPCPAGSNLLLHGFPWGVGVKPCRACHVIQGYNVALIHAYVWSKKCSYPKAPPEKHFSRWMDKLKGYKVALFGDNHKGFMIKDDDTTLVNCGAFIRRNVDEVDYAPKITLLWSNGHVTRVALETGDDAFQGTGNDKRGQPSEDLTTFMEAVKDWTAANDDFADAVIRFMNANKTSPEVMKKTLMAIERAKK